MKRKDIQKKFGKSMCDAHFIMLGEALLEMEEECQQKGSDFLYKAIESGLISTPNKDRLIVEFQNAML